MRKVIIIDTSILCVWLKVPGMESCGKDDDQWDYERINQRIEEEIANKSTLVLPFATIIETGNHISQTKHSVWELANALSELMKKSADEQSPWAAFSEQSSLWTPEKLKEIASTWPNLAIQNISLGDATIKDVAEYYAQMGYKAEILTGDTGLKAYQPEAPAEFPRRRKRR